MFKKLTFLVSVILLLFIHRSTAQRNLVYVDEFSGTANVIIPIHTIKSGSLVAQVNLVNSGNGVKVKDVEGNAGMGWQISGVGKISRQVRGLPDDCLKDKSNNARLGWLNNTNGTKISNFTIANDNNSATCPDETTDINYINTNFSDLSDTEPDLFSINAPGLSLSFVFDKDRVIRTIPYQDVKITYNTNSLTGDITDFTVVDDKGNTYLFSTLAGKTVKKALTSSGGKTVTESNIEFFKNQFKQYKNGIEYYNEWHLYTITDANNNSISYSYNSGLDLNTTTPVDLYVGTASSAAQYWMNEQSKPLRISSISGGGKNVYFTYNNNYFTSQGLIGRISVSGLFDYLLNYSAVLPATGKYARYFLRSISTNQCNSPITYGFDYTGETLTNGTYKTSLGDSTSVKVDYWGYASNYNTTSNLKPSLNINPSNPAYQRYQVKADNLTRTDYSVSLPGADRRTDPSVVASGALSKISYYDNGATILSYEPHDFYDNSAGAVVQGGGIRIKSITEYDGINVSNNIVRTYSYTNPANSLSSGKAVSLPVYGFSKVATSGGSTADQWAASTVYSDLDLSQEDHSIIYSNIKVTQNGAGSTATEYYTPATNYDVTAVPSCQNCNVSDWAPTLTNIARNSCISSGFVANDRLTYPFAPNTNYDFERGLLKSVKTFNDSGTLLTEANYTYQRTAAPIVVTALKFDDLQQVLTYSKYQTLTSVGELTSQVTQKVFDVSPNTLVQQTTDNYFYTSPAHKELSRQQRTKSDGTIENSFIKYSKDYVTTGANDLYVTALYNLQLKNINIPIEQYTQVQKPDLSIKVTSASLVKFQKFDFTSNVLFLPVQKLAFMDPAGTSSFTPSTVTSGTFVQDPKYIITENDLIYDRYGYLQTSDNNMRQVQTVLSDPQIHLPVAAISNAAADEIIYHTRDHLVENTSFTMNASFPYTGDGRTGPGSLAYEFPASLNFTKTLKKAAGARNYIFSAWINSSITNTLSLTLTGTDNVPNVYTLNYTASSGNWKYYELKVPVTNLSPTFTAKLQKSAATVILITDILFYPEKAEISTVSYDKKNFSKTSQTTTNGISTYYSSDNFGRLQMIYDQDKQVTERNSYNYSTSSIPFSEPTFNYTSSGGMTSNDVFSFTAVNNYGTCQFVGLTFTWNFGDGTAPIVTTSTVVQTHKYANAGTYNITLTVSAAGYTSKSTTQSITLTAPILRISILYANESSAEVGFVRLSQNGVTKYQFTENDLMTNEMKVPEGEYTVTVTTKGTFGSIYFNYVSGSKCLNYLRMNYSVNVSLSNYLSILISNGNCNGL